jgi:hypothetical protein
MICIVRHNFRQYAKYYDVINRDKLYALEASYVAARTGGVYPGFGSGTGPHRRFLATQVFVFMELKLAVKWWSLRRSRRLNI